MVNKTNLLFGICLVLTIFLSTSVLSFGISSAYWEGKPVPAYPGEETTVKLTLQNMNQGDITIKTEITAGQEIASLEKTEYLVEGGTKNTIVPVKIKIPTDAELDNQYRVTASFRTVTSGGTGGVVMGVAMDSDFDVLIVAKPKEAKVGTSNLVWIIALALIIIIAIVLLIRRKKQEP